MMRMLSMFRVATAYCKGCGIKYYFKEPLLFVCKEDLEDDGMVFIYYYNEKYDIIVSDIPEIVETYGSLVEQIGEEICFLYKFYATMKINKNNERFGKLRGQFLNSIKRKEYIE